MPVCITVPLTVIPPLASGAFEPPPTETLIRAAAFDEIACRQRAAWLVWRCLCRFSWCLGGVVGRKYQPLHLVNLPNLGLLSRVWNFELCRPCFSKLQYI